MDDYAKHSEAVYKDLKEGERLAKASQVEYGKWLVNTLWLMHSGSIVGLLFRTPIGAGAPPYLGALWWFVAGIVFAFGAGFAAWWNFTFAANTYSTWADYRMLTSPEHWPKAAQPRALQVTMWIAIACGVASVACLLGGAGTVWATWKVGS